MKRVLMVAYFFPPIGGGGVQRSVKFARYLPERRWQPTVLTGTGRTKNHWSPHDTSLEAEVEGVDVVRAVGPEPQPRRGLRGRIDTALGRGPFVTWWLDQVRTMGRRVGADVDVVYASLGPYESAAAAAGLAQDLGVPWVADLRDPWALDELLVYPSALHRWLGLRRMGDALRSADAIVMNTDEARRRILESFPAFADKLVVTIPNGFDPADFAGPAPGQGRPGPLRIVHTGSLYTDFGRRHQRARWRRQLIGGAMMEIDILSRSHVHLVEALDRLEPGIDVEIHLAGALSDADRQHLRPGLVHEHGYLSHADSVALLRSADLLFLPMHNVPPGCRAGVVPGKTYEYLASGRPILAAIPEGDARDLLVEAGTATICDPDDVEAIAAAITDEARRKATGAVVPDAPDPALLHRFERRRLTEDLANVFDRIAASSPGGPTGSAARSDVELG